MPEDYKRHPNTNCSICQKPVYKRPWQLKFNKNKAYCSPACYGLSCRKEKPCIICGKLILAGENKKTCSRICANKHRAGIKYKLNEPRKDKVKFYRSLKIRLMNTRGKVCEKCGYDKSEILQIHHKDSNRLNNEISNLELICPNCHFEKHYLEKSWLKN
jgi:HNH endonuclease